MPKKLIAECLGTATLVLFGCGAAVLAGAEIGPAGIALAFGLTLVATHYGLGALSGAHFNPAVSLGMMISGRMTVGEFIYYAAAQIAGAVIGAVLLYLIASGKAGFTLGPWGLWANGYGPGFGGAYALGSALLFEFVASFLFVTVVLGATGQGSSQSFAGLAIGLSLTAIHLVGIPVTGVSVNPARSIGPALFAGGAALLQLWVFLLAPLAGGALAGLLHGLGFTRAKP